MEKARLDTYHMSIDSWDAGQDLIQISSTRCHGTSSYRTDFHETHKERALESYIPDGLNRIFDRVIVRDTEFEGSRVYYRTTWDTDRTLQTDRFELREIVGNQWMSKSLLMP